MTTTNSNSMKLTRRTTQTSSIDECRSYIQYTGILTPQESRFCVIEVVEIDLVIKKKSVGSLVNGESRWDEFSALTVEITNSWNTQVYYIL